MQKMDLLTANEAAVLMCISPNLIRQYVASGRLVAVRNGHTIRIPRSEVDKIVRQCERCYKRFVPKFSNVESLLCPACKLLYRPLDMK